MTKKFLTPKMDVDLQSHLNTNSIIIMTLGTLYWKVGFSIWKVAFVASAYENALYNAWKKKYKIV